MTTSRDHFSQIARGYAAYRPRYPEELFDFLAERAPARKLAWDCACGNGQATIDLDRAYGQWVLLAGAPTQIPKQERKQPTKEECASIENDVEYGKVVGGERHQPQRFEAELLPEHARERVAARRVVVALWVLLKYRFTE